MRSHFFTPLAVCGLVAVLASSLAACRLLGIGQLFSDAPTSTVVLWSGAVTDTSARVHARLPDPTARVRLLLSREPDFSAPRLLDGTRVETPQGVVVHFRLSGLQPAASYYYALEVDGRADSKHTGRLRTFAPGPFSFRVAVGSCATTGSRHSVFDTIRTADPDLFLHLGDMHYENIDVAEAPVFREAYHRVHASPKQAALYRSVPIAYVWDDHDYGPNNSSRQAPGNDAAQRVYREYVPHYPLPAGNGPAPVYQAFTVGRVRFILTDLRSVRSPNETPDTPAKTMMGAPQKAWFKEELRRARDRYPVIVWASTVSWIANDPEEKDRWSGFTHERAELATYIDSIGAADQLVILSGDAHMVALDDGTHNHYGTATGGGFPVVQAAALDRRGSVKGGPYTHGPYPNRTPLLGQGDGQFVLMDVADNGEDAVCVTWTGRRLRYDTQQTVDLLAWRKCFPEKE